ncbi:MAG: cobyrinate a,c-diamide synthase [Thermoanaerobacteraceae bacterium]|nr:cobyrinate a,c-diamide synthase [Thermoanaerobacteraceae bacterium]
MHIPRLVIAGTHSGVGKTTLATGIMAALTARGYRVQGFKVGPDYIDPGYHRLATGRASRNLDCWMMGEDRVRQSFVLAGTGADICIIEGVMGLFDGSSENGAGSTAEIARILQAPVILVVDVRFMGQSAAAVVQGYRQFWRDINVAGVILNKVGSQRHRDMVVKAIESHCGVPILGTVLRDEELTTPERHLGLLPVAENRQAQEKISVLGRRVASAIDLERLVGIAKSAAPVKGSAGVLDRSSPRVEIAVARDEAFNFYYQDGLDMLEACGAELAYFSPIRDSGLPPRAGGLLIGGGFPESYLQELSENRPMLEAIGRAYRQGMPIYAECGGYMYLTRQVTGTGGDTYPMVGIVPGTCIMEPRLVGMGYIKAVAQRDNILCLKGDVLRGHEFHYSRFQSEQPPNAFVFYGGRAEDGRVDGYADGNLLASYLHLNFFGHQQQARRFVERCVAFRNGRTVDND